MKAGRAQIGIFKNMCIKNLRIPIKKKLDSFTLKTSINHLIHNILCNGRVKVKIVFNSGY